MCVSRVQKQATGQTLLQKVYSHVDLLEVKYFGLQFTDSYNVNVSLCCNCHYLWPPCVALADIIFCPVVSIFLSIFFLPSPNLSGRRLDVYRTPTHDVALLRI